ncbi:thiaminase II [Alicyclobacillus suci]|uniref:thiaminase II n=1 Tax=Alicyclobacillus suci TaxID=2816080 RepID=UPI001A8F1EFC|nr:thiaminase II [Alicyclobacillus suci]
MRFTEELRREADPIFEAIRNHPFVRGIAEAALSPAQITHYVQQDSLYLSTYAKVYSLGLTKCRTRAEMREFHERIGFILNAEVHPHLTLCRFANVSYETLQQSAKMAPTAHHYASHMLACAQAGTLGDVLATVLPCHWTYVDLARNIVHRDQPTKDHPLYEWIAFYANDDMLFGLTALCRWINEYAERASDEDRVSMQEIFLVSCHMERRFFEMAYTLENW